MVMRYVHLTQDHMDAEMVRISEQMKAEPKESYNKLQSWPRPTGVGKGAHGERTFNNLGQGPTKNEKPISLTLCC